MLTICKDAADLSARAAEFIAAAARQAISERGRFTLALTGGSTPEATYTLLAEPHRMSRIEWSSTYIFFGDERFVPPDDPRSNFGMAERSLLGKVPIPASHVFPIMTSWDTPEQAAAAYSEELATFFEAAPSELPPQFDLVLLGMGDDGHIASLFPGFPTLQVADKWVVGSPPGTLPPPVDRVTLTYPVINAARSVLFLISGEKKAEALRDVLEGNAPREKRPAAGVRPTNGELTWLVDEDATSLLSRKRSQ